MKNRALAFALGTTLATTAIGVGANPASAALVVRSSSVTPSNIAIPITGSFPFYTFPGFFGSRTYTVTNQLFNSSSTNTIYVQARLISLMELDTFFDDVVGRGVGIVAAVIPPLGTFTDTFSLSDSAPLMNAACDFGPTSCTTLLGYDLELGGLEFASQGAYSWWNTITPPPAGPIEVTTYGVPTPAMLPGLISMGIAAWRKRRQEEMAGEQGADPVVEDV